MQIGTLAIYGVGLLGGSVGLAAKQKGMTGRVIGIGRSLERLQKGVDLGAADEVTTDLGRGLADADMVVLASTVSHIVDLLPRAAAACKAGAIVTDVGSTKATIVSEATKAFAESSATFVGSHPMAGSEQSGVAFASAELFNDACCIVTSTPANSIEAANAVVAFWESLGARIVLLEPEQHDRMISRISHLPHLAAAAVLLAATDEDDDHETLASLLGNGFRDTTRVAEGPAEVWRDICLENRGPIADDLDRLAEEIRSLAGDVREGRAESLVDRLERARQLRKRLVP